VACNLPCSALTTYSAAERIRASVERACEVSGQAKVMVVGAGGLGVWCTLIVKAMYKWVHILPPPLPPTPHPALYVKYNSSISHKSSCIIITIMVCKPIQAT
jgi:hypothetical protein